MASARCVRGLRRSPRPAPTWGWPPIFARWHAPAASSGDASEGLALLERAFDTLAKSDSTYQLPELLSAKGELLSRLNPIDGAAEDWFRQSLAAAREQGARLAELRAALRLARLMRGRGRDEEARELLVPAYAVFSEGFDTPDLAEAKGSAATAVARAVSGGAAKGARYPGEEDNVQSKCGSACWRHCTACHASGSAAATELTILWAEWDPANYLQELANEYEKETGVKVTVETTAWPGFQNQGVHRVQCQGDAYDMVVGDSQWLGAGSTGGHYVELTDFVKKHDVSQADGPCHDEILLRISRSNSGSIGPIPLEGDAIGWAYRKDWFEDPKEMEAFKAKYGYDLAAPKISRRCATSPSSSIGRDQNRAYGIAIYTDRFARRAGRWASKARCSPTAASSATMRPARSTASSTPTRRSRRWTPTRNSTRSRRRAGPTPDFARTTWRSPRIWPR